MNWCHFISFWGHVLLKTCFVMYTSSKLWIVGKASMLLDSALTLSPNTQRGFDSCRTLINIFPKRSHTEKQFPF